MAHLYKSRLQNYAQKRNIPFPTYSCEMEGPPHARLFKASVTIDGHTYEGREYCTTLKDAEHAAAKVAFTSLSPTETLEDDCLYKSLLQELAQKRGLLLPVYSTNRIGPPHMASFASMVEIAGEQFVGQEARTKKQAEMIAAKVAYTALTADRPRTHAAVSSDAQMVGASRFQSSSSQKNATVKKEVNPISTTNKMPAAINDQANHSVAKQAENGKEKDTVTLPQVMIHESRPKATPNVAAAPQPNIRREVMIHESRPKATPNVAAAPQPNIRRENIVSQAGQAHEGLGSNGKNTSNPAMDSGAARLPPTKIVIRPHKPGMTYDGPIQVSDDEWVAMKVNLGAGM